MTTLPLAVRRRRHTTLRWLPIAVPVVLAGWLILRMMVGLGVTLGSIATQQPVDAGGD